VICFPLFAACLLDAAGPSALELLKMDAAAVAALPVEAQQKVCPLSFLYFL